MSAIPTTLICTNGIHPLAEFPEATRNYGFAAKRIRALASETSSSLPRHCFKDIYHSKNSILRLFHQHDLQPSSSTTRRYANNLSSCLDSEFGYREVVLAIDLPPFSLTMKRTRYPLFLDRLPLDSLRGADINTPGS